MITFSKCNRQLHHPKHQIPVSTFDPSLPLASHCGLPQVSEINLFKRPVTITFIKEAKGQTSNYVIIICT